MYLSSLRVAADSAADAARTDDMARYEAVAVFITVTSQVALRPSRQGIEVKPSGHLVVYRPTFVNPYYYYYIVLFIDNKK